MQGLDRRLRSRRGFTTLTLAVCAVAIFGMLGLSVDLGRMMIAKNEAQAYVDSAALDAVVELDGTSDGLELARKVVLNSKNRWNFGQNSFREPTVEFASAADGPWELNPAAAGMRFVRVTASLNQPNYFIQAEGGPDTSTVRARAVGGQVERTSWREGVFPFSPMSHDGSDKKDFGLVRGNQYTLRWASNPMLNKNTCPGDNLPNIIAQSEAGGGSERGFIEETSASVIRETILGSYQTVTREIGGTVTMTGGAKQAELDALIDRINQDTDTTSMDYDSYRGNGRRLVAVPINTWSPDYRIVMFAAFLLLPTSEYTKGGNEGWCGIYVGPYIQGGRRQGGGQAGAYVARLVQ